MIIDIRGIVDDGTPNQTCQGYLTVNGMCSTGANMMISQSLAGTGQISLPTTGFFTLSAGGASGQGLFTGSLPSATQFPGGEILIVDTGNNYPFMLSGTIAMMNSVGASVVSSAGTHLSVTKGGSVGLWSDAAKWLVCAVNGTATLSA